MKKENTEELKAMYFVLTGKDPDVLFPLPKESRTKRRVAPFWNFRQFFGMIHP
jgi:hypothetical protein